MQMLLIHVRGSSKDYADIHTLVSHGVDALTLLCLLLEIHVYRIFE